MKKSSLLVGVLIAAAGAVAAAQVTQSGVRGKLRPTDDTSRAKGKFVMISKSRSDVTKETISVGAIRLDATRDDEGNRPVYDLWLVDVDESEADFGDLRMNRRGTAGIRWNSRRDDYPEGVTSITEFGDGTMQVRDADGNVVLEGSIPEFLGLTDDNSEGSHAAARARARSRLRTDDDTSDAEGRIEFYYINRPRELREVINVWIARLDPDAGPYDVVAIDAETEIDLGAIETDGRAEKGRLRIDTRADDTIPGDGSILDLSGLDVEVRNAAGDVVLSGSLPTIE